MISNRFWGLLFYFHLPAFTLKVADGLKQQADQITSTAATQKEATFEVSLAIYQSMTELATVAAPGETTTKEKQIPLHLEVELYEFKNQYSLLDLHISHTQDIAAHAATVGSFLRKVDVMDSGFLRMAIELKAEKEATTKTLEKLEAIRMELGDLTTESRTLLKAPKAADKVNDLYTSLQQQARLDLEKMFTLRLNHSRELSVGLDPLLLEFKALLAYQTGLRQLAEEMNEHERWITKSAQKVQSVQEQIKQMFSSWPGDELEQRRTQAHESMVVFDVDEQVEVDDLDVLMADMDKEFAHVQAQKPAFQGTRESIEIALENATAHSKQLQLELEWVVDSLATKIQRLETDIRTKSLQLQALERRAIWEKEIEVARSWFKDFAKAVILFAREQSKWKTSHHRDFDDAASIRSYRTTASRMVIDRLGLSVMEFEDQVEVFETESRPRVDKAWSELCSALVFIARSVPDEFQRRQTALGREFDEIRKQVAYSSHIVTQRKSLEDVAFRLEELDGYKEELRSSGMSIKSGRYGPEATALVKTKKGKGERFTISSAIANGTTSILTCFLFFYYEHNRERMEQVPGQGQEVDAQIRDIIERKNNERKHTRTHLNPSSDNKHIPTYDNLTTFYDPHCDDLPHATTQKATKKFCNKNTNPSSTVLEKAVRCSYSRSDGSSQIGHHRCRSRTRGRRAKRHWWAQKRRARLFCRQEENYPR